MSDIVTAAYEAWDEEERENKQNKISSMEDNKKNYAEGLAVARKLIECGVSDALRYELEKDYPELKESEDERIRRELIVRIKHDGNGVYSYTKEDYISWLEKQEKNSYEEGQKDGINDVIKHPYEYGLCTKEPNQESVVQFEIEKNNWYVCIKDYFAGGKKQCSKGDLVQARGGMYMMGLDKQDAPKYFVLVNNQSKQEWSKEDEKISHAIIKYLYSSDALSVDLQSAIYWIKDMKDRCAPQPHWKPSNEQMEVLWTAINCDVFETIESQKLMESLYIDLKNLKEN